MLLQAEQMQKMTIISLKMTTSTTPKNQHRNRRHMLPVLRAVSIEFAPSNGKKVSHLEMDIF